MGGAMEMTSTDEMTSAADERDETSFTSVSNPRRVRL
jgi:hypothetical protein